MASRGCPSRKITPAMARARPAAAKGGACGPAPGGPRPPPRGALWAAASPPARGASRENGQPPPRTHFRGSRRRRRGTRCPCAARGPSRGWRGPASPGSAVRRSSRRTPPPSGGASRSRAAPPAGPARRTLGPAPQPLQAPARGGSSRPCAEAVGADCLLAAGAAQGRSASSRRSRMIQQSRAQRCWGWPRAGESSGAPTTVAVGGIGLRRGPPD